MSSRPKILICDDDPLLIELMEFRLRSKGYDVVTAADGEEALAKASSEKPDLVVLDAMMPRLDGFEALARIKANPDLAGVRVIMLTARKAEREIVSALERGADDYLIKPFIPDELLARLSRLLARPGTDRG